MIPPIQCSICEDVRWVVVPTEDTTTPARVTPCACVAVARRKYLLDSAGIPPEFRRATFDNYRAYSDDLKDAVRFTRTFGDRYPVANDPPGLILVGPAGVGKTHLVSALAKTVIDRTSAVVVFYKLRDLLRLMRDSYNPTIQTTERQVLDPVLNCDLLVLDDLGAERLTDWVADVIDLVIDHRYSAGKPVVATTNFSDVESADDLNGLLYRVGFRTHSRLRAMCQFVTVGGADWRSSAEWRRAHPDATDTQLRNLARGRQPAPPARDLGAKKRISTDPAPPLKYPGGKGGNA